MQDEQVRVGIVGCGYLGGGLAEAMVQIRFGRGATAQCG